MLLRRWSNSWDWINLGLRLWSYRDTSRRLLGTRRHTRHHRPRHGSEGPWLRGHQGLLRWRDGDSDGVGTGEPDGYGGSAAVVPGGGGGGCGDGVEDAVGGGGMGRVRV